MGRKAAEVDAMFGVVIVDPVDELNAAPPILFHAKSRNPRLLVGIRRGLGKRRIRLT